MARGPLRQLQPGQQGASEGGGRAREPHAHTCVPQCGGLVQGAQLQVHFRTYRERRFHSSGVTLFINTKSTGQNMQNFVCMITLRDQIPDYH